jgi:hypothetical protein
MRNRWIVRGILACVAFLESVHLAQAQTYGSGSTGTTTSAAGASSSSPTGASSTSGSSAGVGTISAAGTSGQGIASLLPTTTTGATRSAANSTNANSTNVVPQATDPLQPTYANPYAIGTSGVSTSFTTNSNGGVTQTASSTGSAFGTPVYATTTNTTSTGASTYTTMNTGGFSSLNTLKNHPYATVLGKSIPVVSPPASQLQTDLLNSLNQSTFLKDKSNIFLKVDGSTVFLKGQVANDNERRVTEGFVRMTPGVRNVVNELVATQQASKQ